MAYGIEIFNASGNTILSISNRTLRILTVIDVGTVASGSQTVSSLSGATANPAIDYDVNSYEPPAVSISGTTVSWDYGTISSTQRDPNCKIRVLAI